MAPRDLDRLAARVKAHRLQAYASRKAAADAAGITKDTWQRVEEGKPVREVSYVGVERALGWSVGSCLAVADGGEPVLVDTAAALSPAPAPQLSADVVRKAAYAAARAKMPSAPIGDVDAFTDELVDVLRRAGEVADGE
ncbi:helix-turn-helix domain-containing protein [Streptomyces europaeiscabiei]|uniref:helix-turn-helix domain-containing protein n=1 Tax=Streptomyces europaeiscabiei TaxID=146819 RepID=UPI000E6917C5|nr:helix-turn-helix domain-containing protein [Streptomyces europaeiscabiei]